MHIAHTTLPPWSNDSQPLTNKQERQMSLLLHDKGCSSLRLDVVHWHLSFSNTHENFAHGVSPQRVEANAELLVCSGQHLKLPRGYFGKGRASVKGVTPLRETGHVLLLFWISQPKGWSPQRICSNILETKNVFADCRVYVTHIYIFWVFREAMPPSTTSTKFC